MIHLLHLYSTYNNIINTKPLYAGDWIIPSNPYIIYYHLLEFDVIVFEIFYKYLL